eukprot:m.238752 g.238752  ORF g.238752 m.238752 type:complete len:140 (+) comp13355_c0_seq1:3-422(+)
MEDANRPETHRDLNDPSFLPMFVSEAFCLLAERRNQLESDGVSSEAMKPLFLKCLDYAGKMQLFRTPQVCQEARQAVEDTPLTKFEQTALLNLCPSNIEEAKRLIPSLEMTEEATGERRIPDDVLEAIVDRIQTIRDHQ